MLIITMWLAADQLKSFFIYTAKLSSIVLGENKFPFIRTRDCVNVKQRGKMDVR